MYCNKCGKEISDHMSFCTYCGEKIEKANIQQTQSNPVENEKIHTLTTGSRKLLEEIAIGLLILVGIVYLFTAIKYFQSNQEAFDWLEEENQLIAIIVYWGIAIGMALQCFISGVEEFFRKNKDERVLIRAAISLLFLGVFIGAFHMIFSDWDNEDMSIIFYRVFGTYGRLTGFTIIMAALIFACGKFISYQK